MVGGRRIPPLSIHAREVTSHPIGITVITDDRRLINSVILPKGAPVPSDQTAPFVLSERGQTDASIEVLQGRDGDTPDQCLVLGRFELTAMTAVHDRYHRIEVRMKLDTNGMLSATAYDPLSGRSADLAIDYKKHSTAV